MACLMRKGSLDEENLESVPKVFRSRISNTTQRRQREGLTDPSVYIMHGEELVLGSVPAIPNIYRLFLTSKWTTCYAL